eukprot:1008416_1
MQTSSTSPTPLVPSKHTIITFSDCNETDHYSSSYETYESNTIITKSKSYNTNSNCSSIINESTDYMQSDTDESNIYSTPNSVDHNYDYPWPTSSDDSFANLSETEVYEKLRIKLSKQPQIQTQINNREITENPKPKINLSPININLRPIPLSSEGEESLSLEDIDSKYYDFIHGRYLSVIIHLTDISEYEYEGNNEDEYEYDLNTNKILNVTPIQSTCD